MAYITRAHIEQVFGVANVEAWSNLENDDAEASETRIQAAINFAEAWIDARFHGSRFNVPLVGNASASLELIRHAAVLIAGEWLRGPRQADGESGDVTVGVIPPAAKSIVMGYVSGQLRLDATLARSIPSAPIVLTARDLYPEGACI